jgi:late competence protein required for DNA uptake (superfamily II DNA/RNA helicase)
VRTKVELSIQERSTKTRRTIEDFPANQIPKVGEKISAQGRNYLVIDVRHQLLRRGKRAVRNVLLIVDDLDALSW